MRRLVVLLAMMTACTGDKNIATEPSTLTVVHIDGVLANESNVLAALVSVSVAGADSISIHFHPVGEASSSNTPATTATGHLQLPVLGLRAGVRYVFHAVAFTPWGARTSDSVTMTTGTLPADLPSFTTSGTSPASGYVVFGAGLYGLAIDNSGRVVWYHRFPPFGPGLNFTVQANGRYAAQPATPPNVPATWVEIDPQGNQTRTFGCADGLVSRMHDIIRETDDSYWIICDDVRVSNLTLLGGLPDARVTAVQIQHRSATGDVLFRWSAFDHLDIAELPLADRSGANVNWTHANAIALSSDGMLLVSLRNLSQVIAIDRTSGAVRWRLGGVTDDFRLAECCAPVFSRQHGLRVASNGDIILLDNLGKAGDTRVTRFGLDVLARRITSHATFSGSPPVVASLGGSVQEIVGGHILAAFGDGRRVEEHDAAGTLVWRLNGDPGYVFRAQRIQSLYAPGVGTSR